MSALASLARCWLIKGRVLAPKQLTPHQWETNVELTSGFSYFVLSSRIWELKTVQDTDNCIPLSKNENSCTEFTWCFFKWCAADSLAVSKRMNWLSEEFIFSMQQFLAPLDKKRLQWRTSYYQWDPNWLLLLHLGMELLLLCCSHPELQRWNLESG